MGRPADKTPAILMFAALLSVGEALAGDLSCYENPRTNAHLCFDERTVSEKDGIRTTSLYMGGPNGIRKTSFYIATNCSTGVTHLKDRDGVSFAGGYGNETDAIKSLRRWVCAAPLKGGSTKKR